MKPDPIADLEAEQDQLSRTLASLTPEQWDAGSLCPGWTIQDVVLHLAQTEEAVAATIAGGEASIPVDNAATVDDIMENWVRTESGSTPEEVRKRWESARRAAVAALRSADPDKRVAWAAAPLRPVVLATTRLAEHWAHSLDITEPLGIDHPESERLRHIAWLAHRTIPYAFARAGRDDPPEVRLELEGPAGDLWEFGPPDAACVISGAAGELCRVAARRLDPNDAQSLKAEGERGEEVLELIRTYA